MYKGQDIVHAQLAHKTKVGCRKDPGAFLAISRRAIGLHRNSIELIRKRATPRAYGGVS